MKLIASLSVFITLILSTICQTQPQSQIQDSSSKVVVGYYVPWGRLEPEAVPYAKLTHINYGFGILTKPADPANIFIDRYYDGTKLRKIKELAKAHNVKVLISIGGWTGSQTFSLIAKDAQLRRKFIENAIMFLKDNTKESWDEPNGYSLDGIDLDWEYPGRAAAKCTTYEPNDTANYLLLLKELRQAMNDAFTGRHKLLTAAVRVQPFDDVNGVPIKDTRPYAQYLDFINLMAYDINGPWSKTTGPNAPFNFQDNFGDKFSFTQAIDSWIQSGFPANQINAGLAFYGRSLTLDGNQQIDGSTMYLNKNSVTPKGDETDANEPNAFCNEGSFYSGVYKYKFIRQGILPSSHLQASNGYVRHWDPISQTPWLYHQQSNKFISYDDPQSIKVKADYAASKGLRGLMIWELSQDFNDELLDVVQAIRH